MTLIKQLLDTIIPYAKGGQFLFSIVILGQKILQHILIAVDRFVKPTEKYSKPLHYLDL